MSGPERRNALDKWKYNQSGKPRLTGKPVSTVVILDKKYSQSGPFVPGERVSRLYPPLIPKQKKDRDRQA